MSLVSNFFSKFSLMLSNGIPLVRSLGFLAEETTDEKFKSIILEIKADVANGTVFSDAFKKHNILDESIITLLKAGEQTGTLDLITKIIPEALFYKTLENYKNS